MVLKIICWRATLTRRKSQGTGFCPCEAFTNKDQLVQPNIGYLVAIATKFFFFLFRYWTPRSLFFVVSSAPTPQKLLNGCTLTAYGQLCRLHNASFCFHIYSWYVRDTFSIYLIFEFQLLSIQDVFQNILCILKDILPNTDGEIHVMNTNQCLTKCSINILILGKVSLFWDTVALFHGWLQTYHNKRQFIHISPPYCLESLLITTPNASRKMKRVSEFRPREAILFGV